LSPRAERIEMNGMVEEIIKGLGFVSEGRKNAEMNGMVEEIIKGLTEKMSDMGLEKSTKRKMAWDS
jgi:hypothetical protein